MARVKRKDEAQRKDECERKAAAESRRKAAAQFREQMLEQVERQTAAIETIARVLAVKDGS